MKTTTKEQWAVKVTEKDGKVNYYTYSISSYESAEEFIKRYKENVARDKKNYTDYNSYEIVKRTVITSYGEWEQL